MQRPKNKNTFGESYARQNDVPVTGPNPVSAAFFPQEDAGATGDVFCSRRCHRCKRVFQVKLNAVIFKYTCWRCGCPVCQNCRTPWPHAADIWACTSCVRPISFIWLFQTTYHGVGLLLRVLEFCDPRSTRILKFLFPAAALQCMARRETPAKQTASRCETPKRRLLLVKASDGAGAAAGSSGAQRRVLVEHSPRRLPLRQHPTQRMARAKTAIKRYSPLQEQQQRQVRGHRARTPNGISSYSPPKRFSLSDYKLSTTTTPSVTSNNKKGGAFFAEFQAPTKFAVTAHVERHELSAEVRRPVDEGSGNRFLRIDATKKVGGRVDIPRIDGTQPSPTPSASGSRSDSPPPRFPSFSQFLDDLGSALLLEEQHSLQPQQQDSRGVERKTGGRPHNTSKVFEVREKEVEVVELGACRESRISTCTVSPNPITPRPSKMGGTTVTGVSSTKKKGICSPPPHLGMISLNASLSMSQRRHLANGGKPSATTPVATTAVNNATTARTIMANHSMTPINHGIHSLYPIASHRRTKATTDKNMIFNTPMHFKLHASRGPTTGSSIPTRVTTPRPFVSVSSTFGGVVPLTERHVGAASFGNHSTTAHYPRTRMSINFKTDNFRLQRMTSNITSPRFARKPTVHTQTTSGGVPISARAPPSSQVGTRSMITSPRTARPPEQKKSKIRGNNPPSCSQSPLMRKTSPPNARNVTPRGSHARTPLQRIASSRLLPSGEAARRYLPTQADACGREPQMKSPPVLMIHLTRQRGTVVPNLTEEKTPRPACIPQPMGKEQPEQQCHAQPEKPGKE
ncbi:hypothetical protein TcG_04012 [Trypanosoma cruzi]|nr:hypothetical protein TcG_04012 [Trypanosoma cruzi]